MTKPKKPVRPVPLEPTDEITVTEAARNFSDVINRVRHGGQRFMLTKSGLPVAELRPVASARIVTGKELARRLATLPHLGSEAATAFSADLDDAREKAGRVGADPWE